MIKTRIATIALFLACLGFAGISSAADYVYRDLAANTLPPQKCATQAESAAQAEDAYNIKKHTKVFCEVQGYGWHVSETKSTGKVVCNECGGNDTGKFQCHLEDVVVTCKRIKPGSVGLFPGKG
ncbi:hypothetical protein [Methylococcus sp. EFPC2]|uniref:hypothetical protein n=1 Tax=Methylococcus sp. EFPC2 TaxID=2812648 RepID=UPI001967A72E|nr:hypothetical protein [Methylococcus sp. EFPC2]QSA95980.1 hypothetical protein JWZ97_12110 [Methylococcus sp. EFPC2]